MINLVVCFILAYLVGSIPTAYIFGRVLKGVDIRNYGSGNVGATNVYRVVGKAPGVIVLLLDALKGFIPVILFPIILTVDSLTIQPEMYKILIAVFAISGH